MKIGKKIKRILTIALAAIMGGSIVSVTSKTPVSGTAADSPTAYLVQNGNTEYKIVTPQTPSEQLTFAAQEMRNFIEEITGAQAEVIDDSGVSDYRGKYISIGKTAIYNDSGYRASLNDLGQDGYIIKTYGDAIVICGGGDTGSAYGVYGLLKEYFDFEIFTTDCWTYDKKDTVKVEPLDVRDVPDIPARVIGSYQTWYSGTQNLTRMRVVNAETRMIWLGHSFFHILPIEQYYSQHRNWFSGTKTSGETDWQLCLTNNEMRQEFVKNLKQHILAHPEQDYICVGQNDGGGNCTCANCRIKNNEYGAVSGLYLEFTNYVAQAITEWMETIDPERADRLQFYMFAYTFSWDPPYVDGAPTIRGNKNVGVYLAPIGEHVSHAYTNPVTNSASAKAFSQWGETVDNFYVWAYSTHFANYLMPHNSFGSIKENITSYVDLGAKFVFEQATCANKVSNFEALKVYLRSQLMWDSTQDFNTLVNKFFNAYYGSDAAPYMYKYWDLMRTHLTSLEKSDAQYAYCASQLSTNVSAMYIPKGLLDEIKSYFDDAFAVLGEKKASDPASRTYYDRVEFEYLEILYLYLELHESRLSTTNYTKMIEQFEEIAYKNGVNRLREHGTSHTVTTLVAKWSQNK